MATTVLPELTDTSALYLSVQQFYARHMHLLDSGRAQEWADTFAPDGTFTAPGLDAPVRGRAALAAAVEQTHARLAASGETHRHWHGMVWVTPGADGSAHVKCYGMVIAVNPEGTPRLHRHCLCEDVLVPAPAEPEGWLVASRHVTPDMAPSPTP